MPLSKPQVYDTHLLNLERGMGKRQSTKTIAENLGKSQVRIDQIVKEMTEKDSVPHRAQANVGQTASMPIANKCSPLESASEKFVWVNDADTDDLLDLPSMSNDVEAYNAKRYECPVCAYPDLEDEPINHEICPRCKTQFGYDDFNTSHAELRLKWLANNFSQTVHKVDLPIQASEDYEVKKHRNAKTFIITGWELRTKIDYEFVDCLRQIGQKYNAELMLAPCFLDDVRFLPNELRHTFKVLTADHHFNSNLMFKYVETHALASSPLSGWKGFSDKTAIIPGLIMEMQTIASDKYCKQITSTGSIGTLLKDSDVHDYAHIESSRDEFFRAEFKKRWKHTRSQKKPTAIGNEYTKPSALIVHVLNDKTFLPRFVSKESDGSVYDLNEKFTAGKTRPTIIRPEFLNVSDTHDWFADEVAVKATFEQIATLKPKRVFVNDFVDGISANYHEKDRAIIYHDAPTIEAEINKAIASLKRWKQHCDAHGAELFYIKSNHCDFFEKILDAGEKYWRMNRNYDKCVELQYKRKQTGLHPIQILIDFKALGITYLHDDKPFKVGKISVIHGHEPINGKRGGFKALVQHYNYLSMNHLHAPHVWRNGACGGLTAQTNMPYMKGISGAMACNTLGHSDNTMQLLAMINGDWIV